MNNSLQQSQQKRRRVMRACDECRKKKVKCDGQQPCVNCTIYSFACTYNHLTRRNVSLNVSQTRGNNKDIPEKCIEQLLFQEIFPGLKNIENMNSKRFSKIFFKYVKKDDIKQILNEYNSNNDVNNILKDNCLEDNKGGLIPSGKYKEIIVMLPPKPIAIEFVKNVWEHCCVLFRFYHRPTFIKQLDSLFETDSHNYTHEQIKFLPLCYSVMAVGALFSKSLSSTSNDKYGYMERELLEDEGYNYFVAAKTLLDVTNAHDLNSIQAIVMMVIFLQCSARLSMCYSYSGLAVRTALREGLHRNFDVKDSSKFTLVEIEMRKRIFYTIYKVDTYINIMLGLPRAISPNDFDQLLPLELSDEFITENNLYFERQGDILSSSGIANYHTKLIIILDEITNKLYSIKTPNKSISHEVVTNLELRLRQWLNQLPPELIPGLDDIPERYLHANRLLHLSFLQVQIFLYRPFVHYLSKSVSVSDSLSLQRARNCISVARTVITLAQEMIERNFLIGSYWFNVYTIFFSVISLVCYGNEVTLMDEQSTKEYDDILRDVELGKKVLLKLKTSSKSAGRIYNILETLFKSFNLKKKSASNDQKENISSRLEGDNIYLNVNNSLDDISGVSDIFGSVDPFSILNQEDFFMDPNTIISDINNISTESSLGASNLELNE